MKREVDTEDIKTFPIDREIIKLKANINGLKNNISQLFERVNPFLGSIDHPCENEHMETNRKLDAELFNINQDLDYNIKRISEIIKNIQSEGVFGND